MGRDSTGGLGDRQAIVKKLLEINPFGVEFYGRDIRGFLPERIMDMHSHARAEKREDAAGYSRFREKFFEFCNPPEGAPACQKA